MSRISILFTAILIMAAFLLPSGQLSASGLDAVGATTSWPSSQSGELALTTTGPSPVDLSITKTVSHNPGIVGNDLTYTIVVRHSGGLVAAQNVIVTDNLPANVTFKSYSVSQGGCTGTGPVICTLGDLSQGGTATVTIVVNPTKSGVLTNNVSVSADNDDPVMGNNSANVTSGVHARIYIPIVIK